MNLIGRTARVNAKGADIAPEGTIVIISDQTVPNGEFLNAYTHDEPKPKRPWLFRREDLDLGDLTFVPDEEA